MRRRATPRPVIGIIMLLAGAGCGTVKTSGTARTATEQLLLTNAWDDALRQVDFGRMAGVPVYLDAQHLTAVDQGWAVSSIRQAMLSQGALLRDKPEKAQWVVEARVGTYGTDSYNWLVGVPQTNIPPTLTGMPSGTIPEIPLVKKSDQLAVTKLALFAYDRESGALVWKSGTSLATATAKDVYLGGLGPIQSGSIRKKKKRIGINLPLISDPEPNAGAPPSAGRPSATFDAPTMSLPSKAADLKAFTP